MVRKKYPSDMADKTLLRFPDGMRSRIKAEAVKNGRSMNAEIVFHLNRIYGEDEAAIKEKAEAHCNA